MVSNQQFRLKWNNHRNTVLQEFETLLHNNSFVDCTIGADGKYLKAHKIVLSACSPYLQNVFSEHFDKHPVILLKDVSFKELKCMIDYMYCGEVNISECELPSFLRTAQSLKIKGLAEDINEYDDSGASDNEHQEISSLTENGRTVEPSVEIHDDEGPPIKRSAPSLIYSNFAGRKRKSPNAINSGAPKSSNNSGGDKIIAAATSKTGGNVPVSSCADTENSDSNVCTTSKDNNVNKDVNDKKSNSQDDLQEHKNKAVVKEEPLDADDDNSSYEFVNNPCDDSDPLNEDSESNCANSGKNFNEVSIANVSSCNEAEANDGDDNDDKDDDDDDDGKSTNVKEELLISELVTMQEEEDGTDEGTNATTTKRASSRNARQLVSKWCEGLAGKPRHAKWNHVKKWSSKNVGLTTTNGGNRLQHDKASRKSRITNVHCPKCGKFYKCRSSLSSHAKFECGKTAECLCKLCQYRTHYPSYLKKHMIRKHKMLAKLIDIV